MFNLFNKQSKSLGIPQKKESLESLWRLTKILMENLEFEDVIYKVVNSLLTELGYLKSGYRIVVLSLIDEKAGGLRRIALSETAEARRATSVSTIPFEKIVIPFSATNNLGIKVLLTGRPEVTSYWPDILSPPLSKEAALTNQKSAGIQTSMVYPVFSRGKPIGSLIFSMVKEYKEVTEEEKDLLSGFTDLIGLAVENSMLFTTLRRTTAQLEVANQKLKELDRLKDDFVSIASHELRTPMTAIRSYVWMALNRSDVPLSQKVEKYLARILISTERLINLVNDMLNVSRIESGRIEINPEPVDLIKLVKDIVDEVYYSKSAEQTIQFVILEKPTPQVFADPEKLRQVLLNLVGNSLKFTPPGGKIIFDFFSDGQTVETSVKDSGVGISKEDLSRLFQKFGRLDNSYVAISSSGGTGLGLYISKALIDLMHGKIWASSEGLDKGATFTFSLPVANRDILEHQEEFKITAKGQAKGLEPVAI
ncbi:GAF domain-containing sensor histidine kinase [Candidatus Microgenomates bacterium]|nr:GAF domain-containing sensor histidine kinase [Candidatus Microgenomates bacterium]